MSQPYRGHFEGSRRELLLVATEKACAFWLGKVNRTVRASLALHVMLQLQSGVFDLDVLASTAVERLAARPAMLVDPGRRHAAECLYAEIQECFADISDTLFRMPTSC